MTALVPGELRGYRRFRLAPDGLHPCVHDGGPWDAVLERAVCRAGQPHLPPAAGCGCGLYAWYAPGDAGSGSGLGTVTAVVAARGRVVLGDSGFRAGAARVEAVLLPRLGAPRWAREALARAHPEVAVHTSRRALLRAHPPDDLSALGVRPGLSAAGRARRAGLLVWLAGVLALYSVLVLPRGAVADAPTPAWAAALVLFLLWQGALVRLSVRAAPTGGLGRRDRVG